MAEPSELDSILQYVNVHLEGNENAENLLRLLGQDILENEIKVSKELFDLTIERLLDGHFGWSYFMKSQVYIYKMTDEQIHRLFLALPFGYYEKGGENYGIGTIRLATRRILNTFPSTKNLEKQFMTELKSYNRLSTAEERNFNALFKQAQ